MDLLREQAKKAYLEGVKDGKKSLKNRGFGNITEAQKMSGSGKAAITKLRDSGEISYIMNGAKYLYDLDDLYHYMQSSRPLLSRSGCILMKKMVLILH